MNDLRHALRALKRQPGFTAIAVTTIALGMAATTAIFSVVDAVVLRPLPYADPERVVVVTERWPTNPVVSLSVLNYPDVRDEATSYQSLAAFRNTTMNLTGGDEPVRVNAKMLTADVLEALGTTPVLGRGFRPEEDRAGGEPVAVLSYGLWQARFGGSPDVIARAIQLNGTPHTIVGVLPPDFRLFQAADVFVPMWPWLSTQPDDRGWHPGILGLGRLKPGVSIEQAQRELDRIGEHLAQAYPEANLNVRFAVTPARTLMTQNVRTALFVLLGAVGGVLLIACINVAGLLLARGLARRRELAVRTALGAGRAAVVRHVLAESLVIALLGGALGIFVARLALPALVHLVSDTLPRADMVGIDGRVMAFTMAVTLVTAIVFGLLPAFAATRVDVRDALTEGARGTTGGRWQRRARTWLVVAEIAVTVTLLVGAGLLARSFVRLQQVTPGFSTERLLLADLPLSPHTYTSDDARLVAVERLLERTEDLPGVTRAAVTTMLPLSGSGALIHFNIFGRPPQGPQEYVAVNYRVVSHGYFETMRIPHRSGRLLTPWDREGSPTVAVINEAMARQFFPGADPLGQRVALGTEPDPESVWMEIVGVVGDVLQAPDAVAKAELYAPYAQFPPHPALRPLYMNLSFAVRTEAAPGALVPSVRAVVREIDANQPIVNLRTMEDVAAKAVAQPRFRTTLLGIFATVALVLAGIGVYGLLAHGVVQRSNEFGVRLALGASPERVVRMVLREGLALAAIGIVLGLAGAALAVRVLASVLYEITPWDPLAWALAVFALAAAALLASWVPARRAVRVDPATALRV